jgi:hypothetical protein
VRRPRREEESSRSQVLERYWQQRSGWANGSGNRRIESPGKVGLLSDQLLGSALLYRDVGQPKLPACGAEEGDSLPPGFDQRERYGRINQPDRETWNSGTRPDVYDLERAGWQQRKKQQGVQKEVADDVPG